MSIIYPEIDRISSYLDGNCYYMALALQEKYGGTIMSVVEDFFDKRRDGTIDTGTITLHYVLRTEDGHFIDVCGNFISEKEYLQYHRDKMFLGSPDGIFRIIDYDFSWDEMDLQTLQHAREHVDKYEWF